MSDSVIDNYLNGKNNRIATLENSLRDVKKILSHDLRNLPISEIERDKCLAIIKNVLEVNQ